MADGGDPDAGAADNKKKKVDASIRGKFNDPSARRVQSAQPNADYEVSFGQSDVNGNFFGKTEQGFRDGTAFTSDNTLTPVKKSTAAPASSLPVFGVHHYIEGGGWHREKTEAEAKAAEDKPEAKKTINAGRDFKKVKNRPIPAVLKAHEEMDPVGIKTVTAELANGDTLVTRLDTVTGQYTGITMTDSAGKPRLTVETSSKGASITGADGKTVLASTASLSLGDLVGKHASPQAPDKKEKKAPQSGAPELIAAKNGGETLADHLTGARPKGPGGRR